ncbi:serine/threonine protein phosphatase [Trinickia symbiotica]|uniref:Serine/threonine protein phosphatase n=1 Tax=Trinickia symbiotica TaxID=863227 RepID=A0A2T3XKT1_9BURK|nr:protein phosphatase 2C domain-containing protein [Trinickia symbiotica]PTB17102.1 serine/threonine protein phosphatase [Trinickia symbiotica]
MDTELIWTSAARTDVGLVRAINEDACLDRPERGLWAVADGMGGHAAGDVASRMVVEALAGLSAPDTLEDYLDAARDALDVANRRLRHEAASRHVRTIGTTVAVCLACGRRCAVLWAGDSRVYLYRDARLAQLTRDHSAVEELRSQGYLSAEEALHHPAQHLITRAVGAADELELDETVVDVRDGDLFLLCSDGLTNEASDAEIADVLACGDCGQATHSLIELALRAGARDNVSAIVVRAEDPVTTDKTLVNPSIAR